jgi:hypothetical protein
MLKAQQKQQKLLISVYWDLQNVFFKSRGIGLTHTLRNLGVLPFR